MAGRFGTLNFDKDQHGWALDAGADAAIMHYNVFWLNPAWQRITVSAQGRLPPVVDSLPASSVLNPVQVFLTRVETAMRDKEMVQEYAFWQIGFAGRMIQLLQSLAMNGGSQTDSLELEHEILVRLKRVKDFNPYIEPQSIVDIMRSHGAIEDPSNLQDRLCYIMQNLPRAFVVLSVPAVPSEKDLIINEPFLHQSIYQEVAGLNRHYIPAPIPSPHPEILRRSVVEFRPAIIHIQFSSRQRDRNIIFFQTEWSPSEIVSSTELVNMLQDARGRGLCGAVLTACKVKDMTQEIADAAGWALVTELSLTDTNVSKYVPHLYSALAAGQSVIDASRDVIMNVNFRIVLGR